MNNKFYHTKTPEFGLDELAFLEICFDNGEVIIVTKNDVVDFAFTYYDRLVTHGRGFCPVARSGQLRLNIKDGEAVINDSFLNSNTDDLNSIDFLKKRFLKGGISSLRFFDDNNWHYNNMGNFSPIVDGEYIIIEAYPNPLDEPFESDYFTVEPISLTKAHIFKIYFSLENCEGFDIFVNEIDSIDIVFDENLVWGSGDLEREIIGGSITFTIEKGVSFRKGLLIGNTSEYKTIRPSYIRKRLVGKEGEKEHDICSLYVEFRSGRCGEIDEEIIGIRDLSDNYEVESEQTDNDEIDDYDTYVGGIAKLIGKNTVLVKFEK